MQLGPESLQEPLLAEQAEDDSPKDVEAPPSTPVHTGFGLYVAAAFTGAVLALHECACQPHPRRRHAAQ